MQNRLLADLERRTLVCADGGGLPIPSQQFWYERGVQTVWWDLDLLYQWEIQHKSTNTSKSKYYGEFQKRIAPEMPAIGPGGLPYFIRENWKETVFIGILDDVCFPVIKM